MKQGWRKHLEIKRFAGGSVYRIDFDERMHTAEFRETDPDDGPNPDPRKEEKGEKAGCSDDGEPDHNTGG